MITYDKYYQTPRIWLQGYDEVCPMHPQFSSNRVTKYTLMPTLVQNNQPLTPNQVFEDVSADHAFKTVTIEPFPHSAKATLASVHPCKHASVMKKVIERMNAGVTAEQQRSLAASSSTSSTNSPGKRRWLGGVVRKVTGGSGNSTPATGTPMGENVPADEGDPMRVDFYLVVFLKFIASIVPTIEVDSTTPF